MHSSFPVPSQGALRALRRIALGTSCTIAVGTALIAEDRRRRIHTVRKVGDNARRIRGSRQYKGAGAALLMSHEYQLSHDLDIDALKWADVKPPQDLKSTARYGPAGLHQVTADVGSQVEANKSEAPLNCPPQLVAQRLPSSEELGDKHITQDSLHNWVPPHLRISGPFSQKSQESTLKLNKQERRRLPHTGAASSINSIDRIRSQNNDEQPHLRNKEKILSAQISEKHQIEAVRLVELIIKRMTQGSIEPSTLGSCILLSHACIVDDTFDAFVPVIKAISEIGGIDSKSFHELRPEMFISNLLDQKPPTDGPAMRTTHEHLKKATEIFLTPINGLPQISSAEMLDVGVQLFEATLGAGLYEQSISIYFRLSAYQNFMPSSDHIQRLVLAIRDRGYGKDILKLFTNIFPKTQPRHFEFTSVVREVLKSTCQSAWMSKAEDVLRTATDLAKALGFQSQPYWFTKVLESHWKISRDLPSTRALFRRLEPLATEATSKEAMHSFMVRFCVLSGQNSEAETYLSFLNDEGRRPLDLRTSGYLILAKAMANDWEGVFNSFRGLKDRMTGDHSNIFTPIFKVYAASHTIPQTEDFLRQFMEEFHMSPNVHILNIMVDACAKTDDIDSIANWIAAMRPYGLKIDSATFNSIMSKSFDRWPKRISQMTRLCEKVQVIDSSLVDKATVNILRVASLRSADGDTAMAERWLERASTLKAGTAAPNAHGDVLELMNMEIKRGDHTKAVYHYQRALEDGMMMPPDVVALAVTACLPNRRRGSINSAMDLIADSRARGLNTRLAMQPLLVAQVQNIGGSATDMASFVKETLTAMENRGLKLSMNVITAVVASLKDRAQHRQALRFWFAMQKHNSIQDDSIDLVSITVLLDCFLSLSDISGIKWATGLLCQNGITPDVRLKLLVKNSRRGVREYLRKYPDHEKANELLEEVETSLKVVMALRARLETRHLVEGKILGVIKAASSTKPVNPSKLQHRFRIHRPVPTPNMPTSPKVASTVVDSWEHVPQMACAA